MTLTLLFSVAARALLPEPASAQDDTLGNQNAHPESIRADSLRQAVLDSIAYADSLAELGIVEPTTSRPNLELIGNNPPPHPFSYNTSYTVLRNRNTWNQDARLYVEVGGLAAANQTTITISDDPDVKRNTRNRSTAFEFGYAFFEGLTSGLRFSVARNRDIIGIRLQNSIIREEDNVSAFARLDRVLWRFPVTLDLSLGGLRDKQPSFTRRGGDYGMEFSSLGPLANNLDLRLGAILSRSSLTSESPDLETGEILQGNDSNFDRSGRAGLTWTPNPVLSVIVNGALRRGQLQRPETLIDQISGLPATVSEEVRTNAENADVTLRFSSPLGGSLTASGRVSDTQILYDVDTTRTNITRARSFNLQANERLLGANVNFSFQNGITESDYTKRPDGYVQSQWSRSMEFRATRDLNKRTSTSLRGAVSLNSRRFSDFQPSGPTSFPPADQDLFRGSGALAADYRPWTFFTTGLEGRVDINRTINLTSTTSINNTDQVGYNVIWSWTANPLSFWNVTQNNSAGAQQVTYPFAPSRDQLSFIYQLRTSSNVAVTKKVTLEMHYNLRYQSRGSFREDPIENTRLYGKTGGSDQYDLLVRTVYRPFPWMDMEVSQQSFVTRNLSVVEGGDDRIDSETRRQTFSARIGARYDFSSESQLSFSIRNSLNTDQTQVNTVIPTPPSVREDQIWQISSNFRTFFDF